jgi:hypothetical protein
MEHCMTVALRHSCRHCRTKLSAPTENPRRAFCCRGCFNSFYRPRCVVCETPIRRKTEWQKTCIAKNCKAEIKRFPLAYSWPEKREEGSSPQNCLRPPSKAHLAGIKFGLRGSPPSAHSLRHCWWGDPVHGDLSLYNEDGLTVARLVRASGRYRLVYPHTTPTRSWPDDDLELSKHRAESIAINSLPLVAGVNIEKAELARIKAANTMPHPMGPPLNRKPESVSATAPIKFKQQEPWSDDFEIPAFLGRELAAPARRGSPAGRGRFLRGQ